MPSLPIGMPCIKKEVTTLKRIQLKELIVPAIVLAFVVSYWIQVRGQSRAVVLIPYGTIWLILILIAVVIFTQAASKADKKEVPGQSAERPVPFQQWISNHKRELGLIVLSIAYCFIFYPLGFTVSNLVFLLLAFPVAGLRPKQSVIYGCVTTAVMYAVSEILQLNAPQFPWFLR